MPLVTLAPGSAGSIQTSSGAPATPTVTVPTGETANASVTIKAPERRPSTTDLSMPAGKYTDAATGVPCRILPRKLTALPEEHYLPTLVMSLRPHVLTADIAYADLFEPGNRVVWGSRTFLVSGYAQLWIQGLSTDHLLCPIEELSIT